MATHSFAAFVVASTLLILLPGPSVLFVIGRSLALGRRGGLLSVAGNELGSVPLIAAVALGVGALVAESVLVFNVVKVVGAAYLAYLGVQAIRRRRLDPDVGVVATVPASSWAPLRQGFVVGVTNPKTIVFFVAVLPQFVDVDAGHVPAQMMALGLTFVLIALICDGAWALLAGTAREWFASSPRRLRVMRSSGGAMMVALSGVLLMSSNSS